MPHARVTIKLVRANGFAANLRYINKSMIMHSRDNGNMISINFAWKLSKGKRFQDIQRKLHNKDTQTGIL